MKISLNWLKEYVDLSDLTVEQVTDKLTTAGLEVDDIEDQGKVYDGFVVGYVKEKIKHPNADKLSLCVVNDGEQDLSVVCGAPNVDSGQKIVLAKVGTTMPGTDFTIKPVKLRGEKSEGMICSEKELLLSENHEGIIVLDNELKEGRKISEVMGLNDVVFDIDITPNRPDALSHYGVARDLSTLLGRELKKPKLNLTEDDKPSNEYAEVVIENSTDCPRYVAKVVAGVEIKESPEWMKTRLKSVGVRPINNVVDVTNFILHEFGQPLHAFDLDMVAGKKIVVKSAKDKEKFVTLDSKERELDSSDLLICDAEKGVAIAGVMGGENSEVTDSTTNILIESAYFRPSAVRKTSKKLGLSTESSYRFERGCNPDNTVYSAQRAAQLIAELGAGKIAKGEIDAYPIPIEKNMVKLRYSRIEKILGYKVPDSKVEEIMNGLEIPVIEKNEEGLVCEIPLFRPDIEREIDLIEEVARIYSYDNIPAVQKISITLDQKVDQLTFSENIRKSMSALGFNEIITNSLLNEETAVKFGKPISILNPQSVEMANARPSLLPGMLAAISKNINVREHNLKYFEVGHTFEKNTDGTITTFDDIIETENLLFAITGNANEDEWYGKAKPFDFYDLRGTVEDFMNKNLLDKNNRYVYNHSTNSFYDEFFELYAGDKKIGSGGRLKESVLKVFDIKLDLFSFTFNLDVLRQVESKEKQYRELLRYPKVNRDFAIIVDKNIESASIISTIESASSKLLKNVKLFDIFESDSLGENKRSLAFQLEFFDETRTLTEEEVNKDFWNSIEKVKKEFNAQLRG